MVHKIRVGKSQARKVDNLLTMLLVILVISVVVTPTLLLEERTLETTYFTNGNSHSGLPGTDINLYALIVSNSTGINANYEITDLEVSASWPYRLSIDEFSLSTGEQIICVNLSIPDEAVADDRCTVKYYLESHYLGHHSRSLFSFNVLVVSENPENPTDIDDRKSGNSTTGIGVYPDKFLLYLILITVEALVIIIYYKRKKKSQ